MSCVKSQVLCCFGSRSCRLCCRCFPVAHESTSTRLMYTFYLMLATAFMCVCLSFPLIRESIGYNSGFSEVCSFLKIGQDCEHISGFMAVYRISLAVSVYFTFMSIFTYGISNSKSWRAGFHNGFWLVKFLVISAIIIAAFCIPQESTDQFKTYWMYVALGGAVVFVIIQLWLLIVFARGLSRSIRTRVRNGGSPFVWYGFSIVCGVVGFCLSVAGVFFLAVNYTEWKYCATNKLFIGVTSLLIVICSAVAMLPCSRRPDINLKSSLLQSSIMSLYILYLTWSALSSEPREPIPQLSIPIAVEALAISSRNSTNGQGRSFPFEIEGVDEQKFYCGPDDDRDSLMNKYLDPYLPYIGVVVMFFTVIYSSIGTSASQAHDLGVVGLTVARRRHKKNLGCWRQSKNADRCSILLEDDGGQRILRNEKDGVIYSYSLFHAIFALATMYIMVQLTGWFRPDESNIQLFSRNWSSVWIKMCTSWACALMYLISLMLPTSCFQGRDGVRVSAIDDDLQLPDS